MKVKPKSPRTPHAICKISSIVENRRLTHAHFVDGLPRVRLVEFGSLLSSRSFDFACPVRSLVSWELSKPLFGSLSR
jgi:hypothetical protein